MKYELNVRNATCDEYLDGDIFPYISQTQNNSDCLYFSLLKWHIQDVNFIDVKIMVEIHIIDHIDHLIVLDNYLVKEMFKH